MFWLLGYFSPRQLSKKSSWLKHQLRRPAEYAASAMGKFDAPPSRQSLLSSVTSHFRRNNLLPLFLWPWLFDAKKRHRENGRWAANVPKIEFPTTFRSFRHTAEAAGRPTAKQNSVRVMRYEWARRVRCAHRFSVLSNVVLTTVQKGTRYSANLRQDRSNSNTAIR